METMAPNPRRFLATLIELAQEGCDTASLDLHLDALIAAGDGDLTRAVHSFTAAQNWESSQGFAAGALHTSHQMALTTNFAGDLDRLSKYYRETILTLTKMKNRQGVALCMRSVGEIAVIHGNRDEMAKAWDLSERLFRQLNLPEAAQLAKWRACAGQIEEKLPE